MTMRKTHVLLVLAILILVALSGGVNAASLEVGIAVTDITPPSGYRMSGYFRERLNTGTHNALQAKAIVFRQDDEKAALVFCDLIGMSLDVSRQVRESAHIVAGLDEFWVHNFYLGGFTLNWRNRPAGFEKETK